MTQGRLEGEIAIVTGSDSGIGQATAIAFAREGADVAVCGRLVTPGDWTMSVTIKTAWGR